MPQAPGALPAAQPGRSFSWSEAWLSAVTRPSVATFEELASDPAATGGRAYLWLIVANIIGVLVQLALIYIQIRQPIEPGFSGFVLRTLLSMGVAVAVAWLVGFFIASGVTHLIARLLGGRATYSVLAFAYASYTAPLMLVNYVLGGLPSGGSLNCAAFPQLAYVVAAPYTAPLVITRVLPYMSILECLALVTGTYAMVLNVIAVKAVHRFGWGRAITASLILWLGLVVLVAYLVNVILAILERNV